ncbi:response regulator [Saccharibacillus kuerlensis]|uniref:DNA-binding response regulator n=1 Tax=Saccharibacillus kuerlensis TaxID=459527 RepID=A0ABQ2KZB1_9BACL|nr:response regulator [Saccharibacillus kuerlensis]GGN97769.1 DNA-binding response regulator [Saccharibacillus kuerlensis]
MIKALLIDDEKLAVMHMEKLLRELPEFDAVESYTDPLAAVEAARKSRPDVIFLDIVMPELNGMQAAELMQQASPDSDIVFVTGYDRYAIEAFEMNALDYVLKPVQRTRLAKTLSRLIGRRKNVIQTAELQTHQAMIGSFKTLRPNAVPGTSGMSAFRWRTSRAQEMFAYLLHYRERFVGKDKLIQQFWPESPFKRASTYLYTTIYQIRQCLKQSGLDVEIANASGGEGYTLHLKNTALDVDQFETGLRTLGAVTADNCAEHIRLSQLYIGDYLADYDYSWAEGERQRLRSVQLHHASGLALFLLENGRTVEAAAEYTKLAELHPYSEHTHLGLLQAYALLGDQNAVDERYRQAERLFEKELDVETPLVLSEWYKRWNAGEFSGSDKIPTALRSSV